MKMISKYLEEVVQGRTQLSKSPAIVVAGLICEIIILIIDRSWSMAEACGRGNRLEAAQSAAISLIRARLDRGADDRVAVIAFNEEAQLILPSTGCREEMNRIERAIRSIKPANGTDLNAPLLLAEKSIPIQNGVHIVLLTDGHGGDPTRLAASLKQRGALLDCIGVGQYSSDVDEAILKKTASVLNGQVLYRFIGDADSLNRYFREDVAFRLTKRTQP